MLTEELRAEIRDAVKAELVARFGDDTPALTMNETAAVLGLSSRTLYNHIYRGTIPKPEQIALRLKYRADVIPTLKAALSAYQKGSTPPARDRVEIRLRRAKAEHTASP